MLVDLIVVRPNFMKIASIIRAFEQRMGKGGGLRYRLIHTGQHYDPKMSGEFFRQLGIPEPNANLEVGSGTQAEQTGAIMSRYEALLLDKPSNLCLVVGDVTSTMACAIAAQKLRIPVAHVEAGIRSGDWTMPEEINRMVTDSITNWFFTTSEVANENLRRTGVGDDRIFFVGNTMIDTLLVTAAPAAGVLDELGLKARVFRITLHRRPMWTAMVLPACWRRSAVRACRWCSRSSAHGKLADLNEVPANSAWSIRSLILNSISGEERQAVITDSGGITKKRR